MPTRTTAPAGAPCWVDLWTSDVEGSRRFYTELFGWEAQEPSPEFGGYFMFHREGVPVAGGMGDMGDMPASNTWKPYFETPDIAATLAKVEAGGGQARTPAMPVADLGTQAVLADPTGAELGAWQPGTFPGFTVVEEPGAPSWFELYVRDHPGAVAFYRSVFGWEIDVVSDTDEFRYSTMRNPEVRAGWPGWPTPGPCSARGDPLLDDLLGGRRRGRLGAPGRGPGWLAASRPERHPLRHDGRRGRPDRGPLHLRTPPG